MKRISRAKGSVTWILIALAALAGIAPVGAATITDAMVSFDKAYIPVLALTSQGKADAAAKAMTILKAQWSDWVKANAGAYTDAGWARDIERIGQIVSRTEGLIARSDLAGAHEALEEIRNILMAQRDARAIPYFVDGLNHYHTVMEELAEVTAGKNVDNLTSEDLKKLASLTPQARVLWTQAQLAPFDAAAYGFASAKAEELRRTMQGTLASIDAVDQAARSGDKAAVLKAVDGLKPAFTKAFLMFGDFDRVTAR
jgi:hypothetical protein